MLFPLFLAVCPQNAAPTTATTAQPTAAAWLTFVSMPETSQIPDARLSLANGLQLVPKTTTLEHEHHRYKINVTYPQIEGSKRAEFIKLNRHIRNLVSKQYAWLLISPTKDDLRHYEKWPGVYNSVDLGYFVVQASDRFLSIYFEVYSYGLGAAHSVQQSFTVNFDMKAKKVINLESLFKPGTRPLEFISNYCFDKLLKDHSWSLNNPSFRTEVAPVRENFASWNILADGIRFNFDACKIDSCAAGKAEVVIPFAELQSLMRSQFASPGGE